MPYQLIGKAVEVRETKDQIRVFVGPREVAVHDKAISTTKQRKTLPAHRPPRGQQSAHVTPLPEERELAASEWANFLGNKALVSALLSRLRHQCHTVKIDGPSLRDGDGAS